MTTGEQYIFRVKAVNPVGTSENSQESDVIKVQAALSMYRMAAVPQLLWDGGISSWVNMDMAGGKRVEVAEQSTCDSAETSGPRALLLGMPVSRELIAH